MSNKLCDYIKFRGGVISYMSSNSMILDARKYYASSWYNSNYVSSIRVIVIDKYCDHVFNNKLCKLIFNTLALLEMHCYSKVITFCNKLPFKNKRIVHIIFHHVPESLIVFIL